MRIGKIEVKEEEDFVIEWSIRNFFSLRSKNDAFYESPLFSFAGESWHLGIYPNGQKQENTKGCIDLYLFREYGGSPIQMGYSLGVKTANEDIDFEQHMTYVFTKEGGFGIYNLFSRTEFSERKSNLLPSGTLTLVCRINSPRVVKCSSVPSTSKCSHCKDVVDPKDLPSHEKKCMEKPIKCPECSDVIALKNWYEHECPEKRLEGACNISTSNVDLPKNKILQDFKELYLRKENCDVVFRVKDQEIPAHKVILSVRSPVLASTFRHNMKEKTTGVVDIEDFDPSIFSDFLCFLYCEDLENLSEKNAFGLFTAADKYDVTDLRRQCMEFIKTNLSVEIFCDAITLALQHNEAELIGLTTHFFITNADKIVETVKWQTFLEENPTQSNELLIKLLAHYKNSKR